jgi:hypothetical protein
MLWRCLPLTLALLCCCRLFDCLDCLCGCAGVDLTHGLQRLINGGGTTSTSAVTTPAPAHSPLRHNVA